MFTLIHDRYDYIRHVKGLVHRAKEWQLFILANKLLGKD